LACAVGLALTVGACGSVDRADSSSSKSAPKVRTVTEGVLTVCTNPPYAPFEEVVDGQLVGLDMDLTSEVAKDLGYQIEFTQPQFEAIESAAVLDAGSCDIGASALTITDERTAKMDFSKPYYETTLGLLVQEDSGISDLADLTGKPVGVQQGTTGEDWATERSELTDIVQFEGLGDQVTALKSGQVAGIFNDEPTLTPYAKDGFKVVGDFDTGEQFGLAVKKGNAQLLEQVNKTLDRLREDGGYDKLIDKWFSQQ
jgi:polar amino acid transport system substrate-binding protein